MSPLTLAFMGDAVYEMLVREKLLAKNRPAAALHRLAVAHVCAAGQSRAYALLEDMLTAEELAVMRRGRNANSGHRPKHATVADYRRATGVEALFGYLYLAGNTERLRELFEAVWQATADK